MSCYVTQTTSHLLEGFSKKKESFVRRTFKHTRDNCAFKQLMHTNDYKSLTTIHQYGSVFWKWIINNNTHHCSFHHADQPSFQV